MTNEEFGEEFSKLAAKTIPYLRKAGGEITFIDIQQLYTGKGDYTRLSPLHAIYNMKQSYMKLHIPVTKDDVLRFNCCIEYAGNHLEGYSIVQNEEGMAVLDLSQWIYPISYNR